MEIIQSSIEFSSKRRYLEEFSRQQSFSFAKKASASEREQIPRADGGVQNRGIIRDLVQLSDGSISAGKIHTGGEESKEPADADLAVLISLIEKLTGKKVELVGQDFFSSLKAAEPRETSGKAESGKAEQVTGNPGTEEPGFEYTYQESYREFEKTNFSSQGVIKTADGMEIDFELELDMTRRYSRNFTLQAGKGASMQDPLVVNLNNSSTQVSKQKFKFDIDIDGRSEKISFPSGNTGFLAVDKNKDQEINNGSELFGPSTGHGFSELKDYDRDNDEWIDETDPIFEDLKVWTKDQEGEDKLLSMGKAGVGAIYLNHENSLFHYKDEHNTTMAQVASTGVFVQDKGSLGTIQELNLSV